MALSRALVSMGDLDQIEAEIQRRGEEPGDFPKMAEALGSAYRKRVPE